MNYDNQVMINVTVDYCEHKAPLVYVEAHDQHIPMTLAQQCVEKAIKLEQKAYALSLSHLDNVTDILFVAQHRMTVKTTTELHKRACYIARRKGLRVPELRD